MTNHQKRVKAAARAFEEVAAENPALAYASENAAIAMHKLVEWLQSTDPDINRAEATLIAAAMIEAMPGLVGRFPNSQFMRSITESIKNLKSQRK